MLFLLNKKESFKEREFRVETVLIELKKKLFYFKFIIILTDQSKHKLLVIFGIMSLW